MNRKHVITIPAIATTQHTYAYDPHHFTGKERDTESGNDYFMARYYNSTVGRFLTPDWSAKIEPVPYAKLGDPQTLNLYAYVGNNPLSGVDSDGHRPDCSGCQPQQWMLSFMLDVAERGAEIAEAERNYAAQVQRTYTQSAQQHAGRQPDGSYRADLSSPEIAPLLDPNHKPSKSDVVGNGECVTFCKKAAGLEDTSTSQWIPGPKVAGNDIARGTAIATLGSGGYPQQDGVAKNSAIYLGKGTNGSIWILDQYNHPAHPPQPREILFNSNPNHDVSNNANSYYVIHVR